MGLAMKKNLFIAVLFGFSVSEAGALSCPEMDPYDSVENAYNNSDLVFLGRIEESDTFVDHAPEIIVEAKWKGPEVRSIKTHPSLWGPYDTRVFFAAHSDDPLGWSNRYPDCFPRRSPISVEQVLTEVLGDPNPPSEYAIVSTNAAFLAMLVAAAAGVGVFAWNSRLS